MYIYRVKKLIISIPCKFSLKYVVLEPTEVTKHGLWGAVLKPLVSKVDKNAIFFCELIQLVFLKKIDIVPFLYYVDFDSLEHMELIYYLLIRKIS